MTLSTQDKLAKIHDLLIDFATAIKVEEALTLITELQEELKPKEVDVESRYLSILVTAIKKTLEDNGHLADGDVCTLIDLKKALSQLPEEYRK